MAERTLFIKRRRTDIFIKLLLSFGALYFLGHFVVAVLTGGFHG